MPPSRLYWLLLLTSCNSLPSSHASDSRVGAELPISRAVLYQNGVGYFERRGWVHDDRLVLRVQPAQIGDMLKSLTVVSLSGGHAVSAALPAEPSRARRLADLPDQIKSSGGLLAIASAFRGAHVVVKSSSGAAEGRLLGAENLGGGAAEGWRISVLTEEGSLRVFHLVEVTELKILDRSLELGLEKSLDVALGEASWKPVDLVVRLAGAAKQELVVSYLVEMPKWRPAYRVVLTEGKEAIFQSWAVVDNLSGEDWHDVDLSLISGMPLAFKYDLYTPRFGQRPDLTPSENEPTASIPQALDVEGPQPQAPAAAPAPSMMMREEAAPPKASRARARSMTMKKQRADAVTDVQVEQSFGSLVSGNAVGAVFRYDIESPVSVRDQESALVLMINKRIPGEEVWLYRAGQDGEHPYRAARLTNAADTVLERGPTAIYRTGTFLGEAMAGHIEAGATTFLPFAVDGRVRIDETQTAQEENLKLIKIVGGQLTAETKQVVTFSYAITNGTAEAMALWVSRPKRPGWTVAGQPAALIEQSGHYYVPVVLAANAKTPLVLREETPSVRRFEVASDEGRRLLGMYLTRPDLSPALADLLRSAQSMLARLDEIDGQSASAEKQKDIYSARQAEVRANIQTLGKTGNADLRATLANSLVELEKNLEELSRKIVTLSVERQELHDKLAHLMASVSLDAAR